MKTIIATLTLSLLTAVISPEKIEKEENSNVFLMKFDQTKQSYEQENPVFRWPLPQVEGKVYINLEYVLLTDVNGNAVASEEIEASKQFMNSVFNPHDIYINYSTSTRTYNKLGSGMIDSWKNDLPSAPGKLTLYVFPESGDELIRAKYYATNDIVSDKAIVPFNMTTEFKVYAAKNVSHMLGLLPTYFENAFLNVDAEDAANCGNAGDFVCDTPFDYLGLKNDVKKKNCKYKGEVGNPDATNLLSNSWSDCMDHITPGQANKIKYNISVIPLLQQSLNEDKTTISMNVDISTYASN